MAYEHMKREPITITEKSWYYESSKGIQVYVEDDKFGVISTPVVPWKLIKASLKRKMQNCKTYQGESR